MAATYEKIASTTLSTIATDVTFSSIPSTYTDLVLIVNAKSVIGGVDLSARFNSDSGSNYSKTNLYGSGAGAVSTRNSNQTQANLDLGGYVTNSFVSYQIAHIMNYSNATTYKTYLARAGNTSVTVDAIVGLWRNTAAITSIVLFVSGDTFASGSTFNLYGIKAA